MSTNPFGVELRKDDDRRHDSVFAPLSAASAAGTYGADLHNKGVARQAKGKRMTQKLRDHSSMLGEHRTIATSSLHPRHEVKAAQKAWADGMDHGKELARKVKVANREGTHLRMAGTGLLGAGAVLAGTGAVNAARNSARRKHAVAEREQASVKKNQEAVMNPFGIDHEISKGVLGDVETGFKDLKRGVKFGHEAGFGLDAGKGVSTLESVGTKIGTGANKTAKAIRKNPLAAAGIAAGGGAVVGAGLAHNNN